MRGQGVLYGGSSRIGGREGCLGGRGSCKAHDAVEVVGFPGRVCTMEVMGVPGRACTMEESCRIGGSGGAGQERMDRGRLTTHCFWSLMWV